MPTFKILQCVDVIIAPCEPRFYSQGNGYSKISQSVSENDLFPKIVGLIDEIKHEFYDAVKN